MQELEQSILPDFCRKPTLVLGCGNILFGDDGFGCAVVDYVEKHHAVPEAVCLLDVGTSVRKLLFTLCLSHVRPQRLLILDAFDAGRTPVKCSRSTRLTFPWSSSTTFLATNCPPPTCSRTAGRLRCRSAGAGLSDRTTAGGNFPGAIPGYPGSFTARRGLADS